MKWISEALSLIYPPIIGLLLMTIVILLNGGCTTMGGQSADQTRSIVTTATSTAAGAYVGAQESDHNNARGAAVGAAAGFLVGETINYFSNKSQREAYLAGYEKGQSNAIKQQYWIARDNQRAKTDDGYEESYYQISVPQSDRDGVRRDATTRVIRVVLPKERNGS